MTKVWSLSGLCPCWLRCLALGGCNLVVSEQVPVFTAADAAGAPALRGPASLVGGDLSPAAISSQATPSRQVAEVRRRRGHYGDSHHGECRVQRCGPARPAAADHRQAADDDPYVLAAGDPRGDANQLQASTRGKGVGSALYYFVAIKPAAPDARGRIVQAEIWPIQCGPPPPAKPASAEADAASRGGITDHPLPGMTVAQGLCSPVDKV